MFSLLVLLVPALLFVGLVLRPEVPPLSRPDPILLANAGFATNIPDHLTRIQAGAEWTLVDLELPRFEMRFETSLGDVLRELGLQTAFEVASADFSGITPHPDGLFLSEAIHQA